MHVSGIVTKAFLGMALLAIPILSAPDLTPRQILPDPGPSLRVTAFEECNCNTKQGTSKGYLLTSSCKNIPPAKNIKYIRSFNTSGGGTFADQCHIRVFSAPNCKGQQDLVTINKSGSCATVDRPRDPDSLVKIQSAYVVDCAKVIV